MTLRWWVTNKGPCAHNQSFLSPAILLLQGESAFASLHWVGLWWVTRRVWERSGVSWIQCWHRKGWSRASISGPGWASTTSPFPSHCPFFCQNVALFQYSICLSLRRISPTNSILIQTLCHDYIPVAALCGFIIVSALPWKFLLLFLKNKVLNTTLARKMSSLAHTLTQNKILGGEVSLVWSLVKPEETITNLRWRDGAVIAGGSTGRYNQR